MSNLTVRYIHLQLPIDYIERLESKGVGNKKNKHVLGRKKAVAFRNYFHDLQKNMEREENNLSPIKTSFRFYAKSWGISKSTAQKWTNDFVTEINKFNSGWFLKNQAGNKNYIKNIENNSIENPHAKKAVGHFESEQWDIRTHPEAPNCGNGEKAVGHFESEQWDKVLIINDDEEAIKKEFANVYFIWANNGGYTGTRTKAYIAYKSIYKDIEMQDMLKAMVSFLHDTSVRKKWNIENFLLNQVYWSYIDRKVKIIQNGKEYIGKYDSKREEFIMDLMGKEQRISLKNQKFNEEFIAGRISFIGREK